MRRLQLETGESLAKFQKNSQLPNSFILLSFFASLYHHFKVDRVEIWLYWYFLSKRWGSLSKALAVEAYTAWNRGIPCKIFNSLIKLYFSCFPFMFILFVSKSQSKVRYFFCKGKDVSAIASATFWNRVNPGFF